MSTYDYLFSDHDEPEETPDETVDETVEATAQAAASEAALRLDMDEYIAMIAAIEAAQPIPAQLNGDQLTGADWIVDRLRDVLAPADSNRFSVEVFTREDAVIAEVTVHVLVNRRELARFLVQHIADQGNLGAFEAAPAADPSKFFLIRRGAIDTSFGWRGHGPRAAAFWADRNGQRKVFDLAKVFQTNRHTKQRRYPNVHAWGQDARGGWAELRLPPGMLLDTVRGREAGLRQALNAPDLVVDSVGVYPVIRLNTKNVSTDFPKVNLLRPELFVRPRTMAERHAAAADFVLPLGVRADGSPILISQAVAPSMGIFAAAGMGKTILLEQIVRAAVLQGAEVILVDAKNGKDLRKLALENLPGVVHYAAGSEAGLHRAVRYVRDEFERRKALAARLQQEGVEYKPIPLLLVFDEAPAWLDDQIQSKGEAQAAAEATIANLAWICSQAREQKCFVLTAGQYAYTSAFAGRWKSNTNTLVILGPPSEINRQALFAAGEPRDRVKELGAQLSKSMKGRGIVADVETGEIQMFQGYFNPAGEAADRFNNEVMKAPRLPRFAWRFPIGNENGGDGTWMDWTPTSDPSSDDLVVIDLDLPDGRPDPAAAVFDPTSKNYRPGAKPLRAAHQRRNSYDKK
ncbi:hypothetical protein ABQE62_05960 [Mycolicibacterium fortuitum]